MNKFFPTKQRRVEHADVTWSNPMSHNLKEKIKDIAPNDTGLPAAHVTKTAEMLEAWCKYGSWSLCARCNSLSMRHLKEVDTKRVAKATTPNCTFCKKNQWIPQPEDVPEQLRGLDEEIVQALRPVTIDVGPYQRNFSGYRVHTTMVRLAWSKDIVEDKIAELSTGTKRKKARNTLKYLMKNRHCYYRDFRTRQEKFLRENADANEEALKRPLRFIEELGQQIHSRIEAMFQYQKPNVQELKRHRDRKQCFNIKHQTFEN